MTMQIAVALVVISLCSGCLAQPSPDKEPRLRHGLGSFHRSISTENEQAQRYFDQGLILTYAFNHEQAIAAFREATRLDPKCSICYWGIALAYGPNINLPMGPEAAKAAWQALEDARRLISNASDWERNYIEALGARYSENPTADRSTLDLAYAKAMGNLVKHRPEDQEAATLYAEALMNLYPWDYWTREGKPREYTQIILDILESVMEEQPNHPGANHLYIHAVEEFHPEKGVASADRLVTIAPEAGHLVHMSSHIYWRVGRYAEALLANRRAIDTDESLFASCRGGDFYRLGYYPHNIHFMWSAAMAGGQSTVALGAARKLHSQTIPFAADFDLVQAWLAVPLLTLVRFGNWDAILAEKPPPTEQHYVEAIWHYAVGLAHTRSKTLNLATDRLSKIRALSRQKAIKELTFAGGATGASELLSIAVHHLAGEILAAKGEINAARTELESAVALHDALTYTEPPPWFLPPRQILGAFLLENGYHAEAENTYREDLRHFPKNGWSLYGLAKSLRAQNRNAEANFAEGGFNFAWERADIELTASRF